MITHKNYQFYIRKNYVKIVVKSFLMSYKLNYKNRYDILFKKMFTPENCIILYFNHYKRISCHNHIAIKIQSNQKSNV